MTYAGDPCYKHALVTPQPITQFGSPCGMPSSQQPFLHPPSRYDFTLGPSSSATDKVLPAADPRCLPCPPHLPPSRMPLPHLVYASAASSVVRQTHTPGATATEAYGRCHCDTGIQKLHHRHTGVATEIEECIRHDRDRGVHHVRQRQTGDATEAYRRCHRGILKERQMHMGGATETMSYR